jgi:hypothetical protein
MTVDRLMRELAECDSNAEVIVQTRDGKHVLLTVAATGIGPAPEPVKGAVIIPGDIDEAGN